jgi:hypothetical protein
LLVWTRYRGAKQIRFFKIKDAGVTVISLVGTFQSFQLMGIVWVFNAIYGFGRKATFG